MQGLVAVLPKIDATGTCIEYCKRFIQKPVASTDNATAELGSVQKYSGTFALKKKCVRSTISKRVKYLRSPVVRYVLRKFCPLNCQEKHRLKSDRLWTAATRELPHVSAWIPLPLDDYSKKRVRLQKNGRLMNRPHNKPRTKKIL